MNKLTVLILALLSQLAYGQAFVKPTGAIVGRQTVISIPAGNSGTQQALAWFPPGYGLDVNKSKTYPLYVFLHGTGESGSKDISQMINNNGSLVDQLSKGLVPYNIDPTTKDTIWWIVVSPHCTDNNNCSYSYPQLKATIPYLISTYRVDRTSVWGGGLSAGGSGTWSLAMADTAFARTYLTGINPQANGGWDENLKSYASNLIYAVQKGLACLYIIGDQDPGYNQNGYGAYSSLMKGNSQSGRYWEKVVTGGTHSANVWGIGFPLTAKVYTPALNQWELMWSLRKTAGPVVVTPPVKVPPAVSFGPNPVVTAPVNSVVLDGSRSTGTGLTYLWSKVCGMDGDVIATPKAATTAINSLVPGKYIYQLTITDKDGQVATANTVVVVNLAPYIIRVLTTYTWSDGHTTTTEQ